MIKVDLKSTQSRGFGLLESLPFPFVDPLIVPVEEIRSWLVLLVLWKYNQGLAVKCIVVATIFKFLANPSAYFNLSVGFYCEISAVEEDMQVRPEQETIGDAVRSLQCKRLYVGRL